MITYEPVLTMEPAKVKCDRCGLEAEYDDGIEAQEFLSFRDTGGYGSVIGDGTTWSIDLCQHCVKAVLGEWIRT